MGLTAVTMIFLLGKDLMNTKDLKLALQGQLLTTF